MDLGHKGKPLSIHNLALSFGRSNSIEDISLENIENASKVYLKNLENVMEVQEMWAYDEIPASAVLSIDERRIWKYLRDHSNQSIIDIAKHFELSIRETEKIVKSLLTKSTIIESEFGKYTSVSQK